MRKRLVAALAAATGLVAFEASTLADGPQPPFKWSGFYVGGYLGRAWGETDLRTDAGTVTATSYFVSAANIDSVNQNGSGSVHPDATVGGAQIGFNVQQGKLIAGFEADLGAFNLGGSRGATDVPFPSLPANTYTVRASTGTDWLLTARARLGWTPQSNLMIYATGGLALTNLQVSNSYSDDSDTAGVGGGSRTDTVAGWTFGGGAEWALSGRWSVKAEYLYVDFGSVTTRNSVVCGPTATFDCVGPPAVTPSPFSTSADLSAHIARVGLNHRF